MHNELSEAQNSRLIDEALASEPIKNTFRLSWEFLSLNRQFTLTVMALLLILSLLGMTIPVVGAIFTVLSSALSISMQIYIGRLVYESQDIQQFVSEVKIAKGEDILKKFFSPSIGAYMGWMVLSLLFLVVIGFIAGVIGVPQVNLEETMVLKNEKEIMEFLSIIAIPTLLLFLLFLLIQPLIQFKIIKADNFNQGFFAVMNFFSLKVWRRAFRWSYIRYVFAVFGIGMLYMIGVFLLMTIPMVNYIAIILGFYVWMILLSVASVMVERVLEYEDV